MPTHDHSKSPGPSGVTSNKSLVAFNGYAQVVELVEQFPKLPKVSSINSSRWALGKFPFLLYQLYLIRLSFFIMQPDDFENRNPMF